MKLYIVLDISVPSHTNHPIGILEESPGHMVIIPILGISDILRFVNDIYYIF